MPPTQIPPLNKIEVIAPNFKRRHSGVTSTVIRLVPLQARDIAIVASGPELPAEVPNLPPLGMLRLPALRPLWCKGLARATQRGNGGRSGAEVSGRQKAEVALHLCRATPPHGIYPLAHSADGCGDRHLCQIGKLSGTGFDGDPSWH